MIQTATTVAGWVGFGVLVIVTLLWLDSTRRDARYATDAGVGLAWFSLLYVLACLLLPLSGMSLNHSWWIIPAVLIAGFLLSGVAHHEPPVICPVMRAVSAVWLSIVRAGVRPLNERQVRAILLLEEIRHEMHATDERAQHAFRVLCTQFPELTLRLREQRGEIGPDDTVRLIDDMIACHRYGKVSEFLAALVAEPDDEASLPSAEEEASNPKGKAA